MNLLRKKSLGIVPSVVELQIILKMSRQTTLPFETRQNILCQIGSIGCIDRFSDENFAIGSTLMNVLENKQAIDIIPECLDAIFDVYSQDEKHTEVIKQIKLIARLEKILPTLKHQV